MLSVEMTPELDLQNGLPRPDAGAAYAHLLPRDSIGILYVALAAGLTGGAVCLSLSPHLGLWLAGQVLLSLVFVQWFALLHEAGHKTLFRTAWLNKYAGHLAGFLALIPFDCWKLVHARHHRWTGWQDLDATTASLVPRRLSWFEKLILNACWWLCLPLFATLYRWQNYWNVVRLFNLFPRRDLRWRIALNLAGYLAAYGVLAWLVGGGRLLQVAGLALYLTLVIQDLLILSQHTHIPMQLSEGREVAAFTPQEQEVFTRSLHFPVWFSRLILLNLDAHELHHVYACVPGYYLHTLGRNTRHGVPWWKWLYRAKRIRADVLLFQNRNQTGFDV